MSAVCVLTPIVVGSWPAIATAITSAAAAMGFCVAARQPEFEDERVVGRSGVETEIPNSEVIEEIIATASSEHSQRE